MQQKEQQGEEDGVERQICSSRIREWQRWWKNSIGVGRGDVRVEPASRGGDQVRRGVHAHLVPIGDQRLGVGEKDFGTWAEIGGRRLTVLAVRDERVVAGSGVRPEVVGPAVEELGAGPVLADRAWSRWR